MPATLSVSELAEALGLVLPPGVAGKTELKILPPGVDGKTELTILPIDDKGITPFVKAYALHDHLLGRMYRSSHTDDFCKFVDDVGSLKSGLFDKHHRNRQS